MLKSSPFRKTINKLIKKAAGMGDFLSRERYNFKRRPGRGFSKRDKKGWANAEIFNQKNACF
jgi:hypothetical protein